MITLTWGNLRDTEFMRSLGRMFDIPMGLEIGGKFKLIGKEVLKQQKLMNAEFDTLLKTYGELDPAKPGSYTIPEGSRDTYAAALKTLEETKFECKYVNPLSPEKVDEFAKLTAKELLLLEPIFYPLTAHTTENLGNVAPIRGADSAQSSPVPN